MNDKVMCVYIASIIILKLYIYYTYIYVWNVWGHGFHHWVCYFKNPFHMTLSEESGKSVTDYVMSEMSYFSHIIKKPIDR